MDALKRNKVIYWVLTILIMLPTAGGGVVEFFTDGPEAVVKSLLVLGYPLYIKKILGFAKILGGIAILTGRVPRLKDWAYAGFTFDFLGATASHIMAHDSGNAAFPFLFFILLMISYWLWFKTAASPTA